jgi:hypothetical protein
LAWQPWSTQKIAEIQEFVWLFNHNFSGSGLEVERCDYTFWAKPVFANKTATMNLQIKIETASGKKWDRHVYLRRKSDLSNK